MGTDFKVIQEQFAAYIRDPHNVPVPADVDPKRMAMYRELFFNNIDSFLSSNFPVLRKLFNDEQWLAMAQDFYFRHRCNTPHFSEIAEEFLDYLQNERQEPGDFPFMLELAHYEWVEMALSISQDEPAYGDQIFVSDILSQRMMLSPVAWPLVYQYPVERIGPEFLPQAPSDQPSYLVVYRDRHDEVHFMQTTPLTFQLLQLIEQQPGVSGEDCLQALIGELTQQAYPEKLHSFGLQALQELAAKGIVIPAVSV
ncbi:MAG: HvfC family RiPP maturation protein [Gammaproteobacteria bacterium]